MRRDGARTDPDETVNSMDEVREKIVQHEAVEVANKAAEEGMIVATKASHRPRRSVGGKHHHLHQRRRTTL